MSFITRGDYDAVILDLDGVITQTANVHARAWKQLSLAREAAYAQPWSHAVLRALELRELPRGRARQVAWVAERLGIASSEIESALRVLEQTEQVTRTRRGYTACERQVVNTAPDPAYPGAHATISATYPNRSAMATLIPVTRRLAPRLRTYVLGSNVVVMAGMRRIKAIAARRFRRSTKRSATRRVKVTVT